MTPPLSSAISSLYAAVQKGGQVSVFHAPGLSSAFLAVLLSDIRPLVFVAPDSERAEELLRNVRFALPHPQAHRVLFLPAGGVPYHLASPDPIATMERMATLFKVAIGAPFHVLVTSLGGLLAKTVPLDALQSMAYIVEHKGSIHRESFIAHLQCAGYSQVAYVEDPGTYAARGSVLDVFWPGEKFPFRIDLFGDEVDRLFFFDPATQRLIRPIESITFGPVKEVFLTDQTVGYAKENLRNLADELNFPTSKLKEKITDLHHRIPFFGIESLLPAFHSKLESPLQLLIRALGSQKPTLLLELAEDISAQSSAMQKEYQAHYEKACMRGELCFPPSSFLPTAQDMEQELKAFPTVLISDLQVESAAQGSFDLRCESTALMRRELLQKAKSAENLHESVPLLEPLVKRIQALHAAHMCVYLPVGSLGSAHRLHELLGAYGLGVTVLKSPPLWRESGAKEWSPSVHAFTFSAGAGAPANGAVIAFLNLCIIAEDDIFGKKANRRQGASGGRGFQTTLADLNEGDCIVHVDHGIGLFKGLKRLNVHGIEQDYIVLYYAGEDRLYLPVHRINCIKPYTVFEGKAPRLDKLGGSAWQTRATKVKQAVLALAQDLLHLYARRALVRRPACKAPDALYWEFEARFPFETTPDQQQAIEDVLKDMQKSNPMDRLICGDVGYGKTEVAMRAAMFAASQGRQVALLAPTTVLAQQHGMTFAERFSDVGLQIAVISRFQKPKEISEIIQKTKQGQIDILVGTHRLLQSDVHFKNLGLLIVDEEQRFGIRAKEHLKKIRAHIDVLTLSATPIPRTLEMGLFGIRDLSIIQTPPVDRKVIRTSISHFEDEFIREAILRELARGGQIYFVHNRVNSIAERARALAQLVPEAKIEVAHGQMNEAALEEIMLRFIQHDFHILICTTIIENGIDVPAANTMFIDDADEFGLSQLYQLRGRVGRSKERAFVYLLIPEGPHALSPLAKKRLEILQQFSELGAGFKIAQHDLELRGAGDLLGSHQHGHVAAVGYDLYADLLKEAVEELKGKAEAHIFDPDVVVPVSALIPDKYIANLHERMGFYQKLATTSEEGEVWDIMETMVEQYGETPVEVQALAQVMICKQHLRKLQILGVELALPAVHMPLPRLVFTLGEQAQIRADVLAAWIKSQGDRASLTPKMKLLYTPTPNEWKLDAGEDGMALLKNTIALLESLV